MEHIKRMEKELEELTKKHDDGVKFLNSEKGNELLDDFQKGLMSCQFGFMEGYIDVLSNRIKYEKKINK